MSNAIAISGSLVDAKNIAVHKSVRLSIDIPAEQAADVIKAFGWPTMANPVPVAVARLAENRPVPAEKERRRFDEMPAAQQAGLLCNEPAFRRFLAETGGETQIAMYDLDMAADAVRERCEVHSRADIDKQPLARARWEQIVSEYQAWKAVG